MPRSKEPDPLAQYDRFTLGGKDSSPYRRPVYFLGAAVGNTFAWLLGQITVLRLGILFALFLVTAIIWGSMRRFVPQVDSWPSLGLALLVALSLLGIANLIIRRVLARDAQRLAQHTTFGVYGEDARTSTRQRYRRKSGR